MSGFPGRMGRLALGPLTLRARRATKYPDAELDPTVVELLFWQVGAVSNVAHQAGCVVTGAGDIVRAWATWAGVTAALAEPTVERAGAGRYTATYAASYLDQTGASIVTALVAAKVTPQTLTKLDVSQIVEPDGRTVTIQIDNLAGAPTDADFLLEVT